MSLSKPPTRGQRTANTLLRAASQSAACALLLLVIAIALTIGAEAFPAIRQHGLGFLIGREWDANTNTYGILPEIWGTLYSSLLALGLASFSGIAVAIFITEGYLATTLTALLVRFGARDNGLWSGLPARAEHVLRTLIQLLAAIPSVVYGLWGIFVVIPAIRPACNAIHEALGSIPFFGTPLSGPGILPAAIVLSIMILPTIAAIATDALHAVPRRVREASLGLGATRWETLLHVVLPSASTGLFGAVVLAFGRALGETMALAMLVGNASAISLSLFSPANTLAALLANSFPEAGATELPALMYAALALLCITLLVNMMGTAIMQRATRYEGSRA